MLLSGKLRHKWSKKMSTKKRTLPSNHQITVPSPRQITHPKHHNTAKAPSFWEVLLEPWVKDPLSGPVVPLW